MTTTKRKKSKSETNFFTRVYDVASKIPYGKVTTYGHIAEACGIKSAARTVGWALNGCGTDIPAHRVVNRVGALTGKIHFGDPHLMEDLLRSEGVEFAREIVDSAMANRFDQASPAFQTAFVAARFAEHLRHSYWVKDESLAAVARLANSVPDSIQKNELADLIARAVKLQGPRVIED